MRELLDFLTSLALNQLVLALLIWTPIVFLIVTGKTVPDPLFDAGMVILGFYFRLSLKSTTGK